jgi:hypothetical protein
MPIQTAPRTTTAALILLALLLPAVSVQAQRWKTVTVTVAPSSVTLSTGGVQQFTYATTGTNKTPVWSATGGTITTSGFYTAGTIAGSFVVTATLPANVRSTASVTITAPPPPPPPPPTDTTAPSVPANLIVSIVTQTSVDVRWDPSSDNVGVVGYGVSLNGTRVDTVTVTTAAFASLVCGTSYAIAVDAVDAAGNRSAQATTNAWTLPCDTPPPSGCPCSIWANSQTPVGPAANDPIAVELGTRFRSDSAGYISAIRFYKSSQNIGPFVGNLWTASGTKLGTVTFSNVTASGWQEAALPSAVAIAANTSYLVSYHTDSGYYSGDNGYFATTGVDNGPLHALRDGLAGANGIYKYGTSGFPTQTWNSSNYWVDVVFTPSAPPPPPPPDTTPPSVPTNLAASSISQTAFTLTWSASTDTGGSGVAKYDVWKANALAQTVTTLSASFSGLTCDTPYAMDVDAVDVAGNTSGKASLTVQTAACVVATPTTLIFTPSADYATNVTSCAVELRLGGDAVTVTPVAMRNLGKPAVVNGEISSDISTLVDPLPAGSYYAVVVSIGPGGSTPSQPSAVFTK